MVKHGASLSLSPSPSPEELGGPFNHLQPHGGDGALVEQRGLGQGPQRVQGLLEQLAAQVGVIPWTDHHNQGLERDWTWGAGGWGGVLQRSAVVL